MYIHSKCFAPCIVQTLVDNNRQLQVCSSVDGCASGFHRANLMPGAPSSCLHSLQTATVVNLVSHHGSALHALQLRVTTITHSQH